jgi:hypothetical protein
LAGAPVLSVTAAEADDPPCLLPAHSALQDGLLVAVAILPDASHVGVVVAGEAGSDALYLSQQPFEPLEQRVFDPDRTLRLVKPALPHEILEGVLLAADIVRDRWEREAMLPFGLNMEQAFRRDGALTSSGSGSGLTCATFVAALFELGHAPLIVRDSWARDASAERLQEDRAHQEALLDGLEGVNPLFVRECRRRGLGAMVRTAEVAGASGCPGTPLDLARAERAGLQVLQALRLAEEPASHP